MRGDFSPRLDGRCRRAATIRVIPHSLVPVRIDHAVRPNMLWNVAEEILYVVTDRAKGRPMDGSMTSSAARSDTGCAPSLPGASFGEKRRSAPWMLGWASRWAAVPVFRPDDAECFGRVADRVVEGNMSLLGRPLTLAERNKRARLRNAIATGSAQRAAMKCPTH